MQHRSGQGEEVHITGTIEARHERKDVFMAMLIELLETYVLLVFY